MTSYKTRLSELAALSDGWLDGAGKAVTPEAVQSAEALLAALPESSRPGIFPTEEGGIHLEWIDPESADMVIDPDGSFIVTLDALLPIIEQHYAEERKRSYGLAAAFGYDLAKSEMEPPPGWTERVERQFADPPPGVIQTRRVWSEPWRETE